MYYEALRFIPCSYDLFFPVFKIIANLISSKMFMFWNHVSRSVCGAVFFTRLAITVVSQILVSASIIPESVAAETAAFWPTAESSVLRGDWRWSFSGNRKVQTCCALYEVRLDK